nr:S9 family peptidase [Saprospiraceae bacterium]
MRTRIFLLFLALCFAFSSTAQLDLGYQKPDKAILDLADVNLPPSTFTDSKGEIAIMLYRDQYKTIAELSEPELRLAGLRINPATNIGSRQTYYKGVKILTLKNGKEKAIKGLPEQPRISNFSWSPDESKFAVLNTTKTGVELWVVDLKSAQAKQLTKAHLNATMGTPFAWLGDGESLLVRTLPKEKAELIDNSKTIPNGPTISENQGKKAQNRTYQDLLKNPTDEHNFKVLAGSEIYKVDLDGNKKLWKEAGMHSSVSVSPNGEYILIRELKRPFSYIVPYYRFPYTMKVYDKKGNHVETLLDAPLEEERPKGFMSTTKEKRSFSWRGDQPASIIYTLALDEGDAGNEVEYRDEVFQLDAPFSGNARSILKTKDRFGGIQWGNNNMAVGVDYWWNTRNTRQYLFNPSNNKQEAKEFFERNYQDRYSDPGDFATQRNQYGRSVLLINNNHLFLEGDGYTPEGRF